MSEDKDLERLKKEAAAAAKAKAAERAKKKAQEGASDDIAKQKAAAAAKAKAAALAKKKAQEGASDDEAKQKAAAAAKAKVAALAKKKAQEGSGDDGDKAKAAAAAKAKTKRIDAAAEPSREKEEEKPSANQPLLDQYTKIVKEQVGSDVIEETYINRLSKDVPTLIIQKEAYYQVAECFKNHDELHFEYLSELHGTDFETHMEVYVYLYSYKNSQPVALKVKMDRDQPEIDSLVPLWEGANWPECETYDLLGIIFKGHPNLHRIMLGEDWVGYPLRKDYEPYDEEL